MAVLVIHFLEAMEIESDQAQRMRIAACAVEFLVKRFVKEATIIKTGERIGNGAAVEILECIVFEDNRYLKHSGGRKDVNQGRLHRDWRIGPFGELSTASQDFIPESDRSTFWNFDVRSEERRVGKECRSRWS